MKTIIFLSFFAFVLVAPAQAANELSLLLIRSPGLNWESPRALAKSTVKSISKSYGLGHVGIRIKCDRIGARPTREVLTGIYNRWAKDTQNAVLKEGHGMGVLFKLFEGKLQDPKFLIPSFEKHVRKDRANFVTFKISTPTCQRLLQYHDLYQLLHQRRLSKVREKDVEPTHEQQIYYGFPAVSRMGEGGGCSGFAISFLEVAGLKENWMVKEWTQNLLIPEETVGYPMRPVSVSLRSLILTSPKRWALENEPNIPLFFWDPDKMSESLKARMALPSNARNLGTLYGAHGLILDRTWVPTPNEPIFLNDVFNNPSDPTRVYTDIEELLRRFELSSKVPL